MPIFHRSLRFTCLAAALILFAQGSACAQPRVVNYFNSGDGPALARAVDFDYTHVVVAFLLPEPDTNELGFDAIATEMYGSTITTSMAESIRLLRESGVRVMLSFGGATVSSAQYAALSQDVPGLAKQIAAFVKTPPTEDGLPLTFDGIDIDWEDTPGFNNVEEAGYDGRRFLIELTRALRHPGNLPRAEGWLLTHAPQPPYLSSDPASSGWGLDGYADVLNTVGAEIDWIHMQYYNNPGFENPADIVRNYQDIVSGWQGIDGLTDFKGLPSHKLLIGKPVGPDDAYSGFLPAPIIAQQILIPLIERYGAKFGGVFGWHLLSDPDGAWAATFATVINVEIKDTSSELSLHFGVCAAR